MLVGCSLPFLFRRWSPRLSCAQSTRSWTGLALPDKKWTTLGNWDMGVPISGDTALFNGVGNTNTSISLDGGTQPIKSIQFDGATATPYTLGVLASADKFNFDADGSIIVASNIGVLQTINAAIQTNGLLIATNSGSAGLSLAGDITIGNNGTLNVNNAVANTTTTLGGNIGEVLGQPGSLSLFATNTGATTAITLSSMARTPTPVPRRSRSTPAPAEASRLAATRRSELVRCPLLLSAVWPRSSAQSAALARSVTRSKFIPA